MLVPVCVPFVLTCVLVYSCSVTVGECVRVCARVLYLHLRVRKKRTQQFTISLSTACVCVCACVYNDSHFKHLVDYSSSQFA